MGVEALAVPLAFGIVLFAIYQLTKRKPSPTILRIKDKLGKIEPRFKELSIQESDKSETEDKTFISLCVKDPSSGRIYDDNTLMYVALHEVAHVLNKPQFSEHGSEWQGIFSNLLDRAETAGVYDPMTPLPEWYCGISTDGSSKHGGAKVHRRGHRLKGGKGGEGGKGGGLISGRSVRENYQPRPQPRRGLKERKENFRGKVFTSVF